VLLDPSDRALALHGQRLVRDLDLVAGQFKMAVTALDDDNVTLAFGPREFTFSRAEVDRYWDGPFVVLWKPPASGRVSIVPGTRGAAVEWLWRRLGDGASPRDVFDEDLRQRIVAFQGSRGLVADGIVGEETLAHLTAVAPEPGVPILTPARRAPGA
jgi:general secretion pathway protein A